MDMETLIVGAYVTTGLALPLFYWPQIRRIHFDSTRLASYSMGKSLVQLLLRLPALLFFTVIIGNPLMITVVTADVAGRLAEYLSAIHSLRRQGVSWSQIRGRSMAFHFEHEGSPPN